MRRSTVLCFPLREGFPGQAFGCFFSLIDYSVFLSERIMKPLTREESEQGGKNGARSFRQLALLSTFCLVNLKFLSTWCFTNFPIRQTDDFFILLLYKLANQSNCCLVSLPFCQLDVSPTFQSDKLTLGQIVFFSTCYFINLLISQNSVLFTCNFVNVMSC